ncbi:unnamed protein product [Lathyrus oleraceus]
MPQMLSTTDLTFMPQMLSTTDLTFIFKCYQPLICSILVNVVAETTTLLSSQAAYPFSTPASSSTLPVNKVSAPILFFQRKVV